jgi:hyperosmotically inducible periplasmic protein
MKTFFALLMGLLLGAVGVWYFLAHRDDPATQSRLRSLHLTTGEVQEELTRSGQIVRHAAQDVGRAVADATADTRATAAIKARLLTDPHLSVLRISVNCTEGRVTLSGTVSSTADISRAMMIALEADSGVREVVSTLQVKP